MRAIPSSPAVTSRPSGAIATRIKPLWLKTDLGRRSGIVQVPDPCCIVIASRGDQSTVGGEGQGADGSLVLAKDGGAVFGFLRSQIRTVLSSSPDASRSSRERARDSTAPGCPRRTTGVSLGFSKSQIRTVLSKLPETRRPRAQGPGRRPSLHVRAGRRQGRWACWVPDTDRSVQVAGDDSLVGGGNQTKIGLFGPESGVPRWTRGRHGAPARRRLPCLLPHRACRGRPPPRAGGTAGVSPSVWQPTVPPAAGS